MPVIKRPLGEHLGSEISGMRGSELVDPVVAAACLAALDRYGVVVFREVHVTDEELVTFSRMLGEVVPNVTGEHPLAEIATITLDPEKTNSMLAYFRRGNFQWHIDGMTDELPQRATLLAAREVDEAGGDTEFATTYSAYESFSDEEKAELDGLRVVHRFAAAQRRAHPDAPPEEQRRWEQSPAREHPLVWRHADGRRSLLIGATADTIVGRPADQGRALLQDLLDRVTAPQFVLRHRWRRGDLVIWDNTGMLHRALPFEPTSRRLMHRTTLVGVESPA